MDKIVIEHNFQHSGVCLFVVTHEGVTVTVDQTTKPQLVTWSMMADVEYLADIFGTMQVRVFAQLVAKLGVAYTKQAAYMALLVPDTQDEHQAASAFADAA